MLYGLTFEEIESVFKSKGYAFFTSGNFNLNIFGIRSRNHVAGRFDDLIGVAYRNGGNRVDFFSATTDPSDLELRDPSFEAARTGGTAILAPGQYRGAYVFGHHGGGNWRHRALQQVRAVTIFRDANRNELLDFNVPKTTGLFGINIHMAHPEVELGRVGRYSAGCQVIQRPHEYGRFINLVQSAIPIWKDRFTYTLFDESDFDAVVNPSKKK